MAHRLWILLVLGLPALSLPLPCLAAPNRDTRAFQALLTEEWDYTMEQAPDWASQLGDRRWNARWPDLSLAAFASRQAHGSNTLRRLQGIRRDRLAPADQLNFDLLEYETRLGLEDYGHGWHLFALNQREGIQTVSDMADALRFATVQDYEDWVGRLQRFGPYLDQTIALLREGIRRGRVQPKVTMQRVPGQIAKQLTATPEASPFYKPFTHFPAAIPAADRARLAAAGRAAVAAEVLPAYGRLSAFFTNEYLPACLDGVGAWQVPGGAEAYAFLCRKFTTTDLTPQAIHDLGQSEVKRIAAAMQGIMDKVGFRGTRAEFFQFLRTDPRFYCRTPEELLQTYRAVAKQVDPLLVKISRRIPRAPYGVEPIPDAIAPDTTTAYYRVLAADGSRAGSYFVNLYKPETRPKWEMMALTLHEACPGHHFQFAVAFEQGELPPFRRYGGERAYTAYIEGWALYAESLGDDMGLYEDPYAKFGQLTYEMWRAVRLVVDTGIHHLRWSRQQAIDFFLAHAAKSELDVINEVDRYISWPGQALAYKVGEIKMQALRAKATRALGDRFDLRDFNDTVLQTGAVPLHIVERTVDAWIAAQQAGKAR
ncbi:MAG: hypothetical protein RJA22_2481 [Verrucomicrobiota bacterium]|jgi:uncharacterized protein (DUF885 family)